MMESNLKSPPLKTELLFTHISHYDSIAKGTGRNIYILVCVHESQEAEVTQMPITKKHVSDDSQGGNVIYNQDPIWPTASLSKCDLSEIHSS